MAVQVLLVKLLREIFNISLGVWVDLFGYGFSVLWLTNLRDIGGSAKLKK